MNGGYNGYKKTAKKTTSTATTIKKKQLMNLQKKSLPEGGSRRWMQAEADYGRLWLQQGSGKRMSLWQSPLSNPWMRLQKKFIQGKWGNGDEREQKLTAAGYDYDKVQARLNELMKN